MRRGHRHRLNTNGLHVAWSSRTNERRTCSHQSMMACHSYAVDDTIEAYRRPDHMDHDRADQCGLVCLISSSSVVVGRRYTQTTNRPSPSPTNTATHKLSPTFLCQYPSTPPLIGLKRPIRIFSSPSVTAPSPGLTSSRPNPNDSQDDYSPNPKTADTCPLILGAPTGRTR